MNRTPPITVTRRRGAAGFRRASAALAAGLLLLTAAPAGLADAIHYGTRSFTNVRILDLREGNLLFETSRGVEQSVPADLIERLELDDYPEAAEAQAAMSEERFEEAAGTFRQLYEAVEVDHLKTLMLGKLVTALDAAGETERAVERYLELLERDQSPFAEAMMPGHPPEDADQREALVEKVSARADDASSRVVRGLLEQLVQRLQGEGEASGSGSMSPAGGRNAPIAAMLSENKAEQALEEINKRLQEPRAPLSKLLHQQGLARAQLDRPRDAALSFMRVIIHFRPNSTKYYTASLIEAGRAFQAIGKPDKARSLWEEAQGHVAEGSDEGERIKQLLGSLGSDDE